MVAATPHGENTAIGWFANVSENNLINATAIGAFAEVSDSNAVRIGNTLVTKIEGILTDMHMVNLLDRIIRQTTNKVFNISNLQKLHYKMI